MRTEILDAARDQLATQGAGSLSLRAVARELGMAPSAVYRYFENRDVLLTALLVDAYDALGAAVEEAEAAVPRADLEGRWRVIAHGGALLGPRAPVPLRPRVRLPGARVRRPSRTRSPPPRG